MSARIAADSGVIIQPCSPHSAHHLSCTVSPRAISIVWRVRIFICIRFTFTKLPPLRPAIYAWQYQPGVGKKS